VFNAFDAKLTISALTSAVNVHIRHLDNPPVQLPQQLAWPKLVPLR